MIIIWFGHQREWNPFQLENQFASVRSWKYDSSGKSGVWTILMKWKDNEVGNNIRCGFTALGGGRSNLTKSFQKYSKCFLAVYKLTELFQDKVYGLVIITKHQLIKK